jgi:predicted transcriptional regulator
VSTKPRLARKSLAEGSASLVLREMKIEGLRVDPADLATQKGILVQAKPDTAAGVSGMLVKAGDQFGIMYATNIPSKGFQKFSIAHELGHYCIDGHSDALLANGVHYSQAGFRSSDPFEQEADYFAAALLMPELAFRKEMNRHDPGLVCIEALRKACETSLTATAIRYAGLTRDGVAVILSSGETIDYCFMSEGLKEAKGISWIRKGTPVPDGTVTAAFNARPESVRTGERDGGDGRLNDWMGGERVYRVREDVLGLGQYGRTLTVLTCDGLSAEKESEYDNEDDELIESWTPKFRR